MLSLVESEVNGFIITYTVNREAGRIVTENSVKTVIFDKISEFCTAIEMQKLSVMF